jgi:hypothetical protein
MDEPSLPSQPYLPPPPIPTAPHPGSLFRGALLGFAANIAGCIACGTAGAFLAGILSTLGTTFSMLSLPIIAIPFAIGLGQWLWLWPLRRSYLRAGETETAKGILVAGAITFLLNAGCWGLILGSNMRFAG